MDQNQGTICSVKEVYNTSLPYSLRHISPLDAANDAINLLNFLKHTIDEVADGLENFSPRPETIRGLSLVVDLIHDKLEISHGIYKFPFCTPVRSAPPLCDRDEDFL